jgi:hypothetical protein
MTARAATRAGWNKHRGLVILAVGYQWFYNGANFLAFKVAGNFLHPLMVATLRAKQQNERADHAGADCSEPALPQGMLTPQEGPNQDGSN